jgi:hypothetical protein
MLVSGIDPPWGRQCDKRVGEVNEHINQMPMPQTIRLTEAAALDPFILLIASLEVMANQQAWAIRSLQG